MKKVKNFIVGYKNEIARTRWDSKEEIFRQLTATLAVLIFFAGFFFLADALLSQLFKILNINL